MPDMVRPLQDPLDFHSEDELADVVAAEGIDPEEVAASITIHSLVSHSRARENADRIFMEMGIFTDELEAFCESVEGSQLLGWRLAFHKKTL